jgi:thioredoxin reductase
MTYDVIVIGGGPAGLSGAVALGRALRSVLVIDSGEGRNAPAEGIHNFLTRDGMTPADFRAAGRAEVERYGGRVIEGEVVSATAGFEVALAGGDVHRARRLLVTTGLVDRLPEVPGLAERWGRTVLHCPYCHGYDKVRLWSQWSSDVRLLPLSEVAAVEKDGVRMTDGTLVARDYLVVTTRVEARAGFLATLGLKAVEHPMGIGTHVPAIDPTGRTEVPGVWVAGNIADPMAQVITSAAAGTMAGAMINFDLLPPAPDTP